MAFMPLNQGTPNALLMLAQQAAARGLNPPQGAPGGGGAPGASPQPLARATAQAPQSAPQPPARGGAPENPQLRQQFGNLAEISGAVQTPAPAAGPPAVSPGSGVGGRLDPGIQQLIFEMLRGPQAPTIPSLGSVIAGR